MVSFVPFTRQAREADAAALEAEVRAWAAAVEEKLIAWRRDIHQHPELGDQESRTPKLVADHLKSLKIEVRTKVARTGVNDQALTDRMAPVLKRAADRKVAKAALAGASEDFSFFAREVPGLYVFLGCTPDGQDPAKAAPNHNPNFFVDEKSLVVGTRTTASLAVNFLATDPEKQGGP
jgi:amidohydrolase